MKVFTLSLSLFILMLVSGQTSGQDTYLSIGPNLAIPSSDGSKMVAGTGFGGAVRVETSLGKKLTGIATIEYLTFAEKQQTLSTTKFSAIPIQVGVKFYPGAKPFVASGFFISGELGLMFTTTKYMYSNGLPDDKFKESGLSLTPGIGYQLGNLEAGFRPQLNLTASGFDIYYLNFGLAYRIL